SKQRRLEELERRLGAPGAWDDPARASGLARESAELREEIEDLSRLQRRAADLVELEQLAAEDEELTEQVQADLAGSIATSSSGSWSSSSTTPIPATTPSCRSAPGRAASTPRTGWRCCCGCTRSGPRRRRV